MRRASVTDGGPLNSASKTPFFYFRCLLRECWQHIWFTRMSVNSANACMFFPPQSCRPCTVLYTHIYYVYIHIIEFFWMCVHVCVFVCVCVCLCVCVYVCVCLCVCVCVCACVYSCLPIICMYIDGRRVQGQVHGARGCVRAVQVLIDVAFITS